MAGGAGSEPPSRAQLGAAVRRGVAWKLASLAANQAVRLVTLLVIARALTPAEFGLAAMAISVWAVVTVLTDLALAAALVQRVQIDEEDRSTAFWVGALSGLILALAGMAVSGTVASFFAKPDVRWLFATLGLGVFLSSLAATHVALLTRAMDFRTLELVSVVATVAGAGVGIFLALAGAGAWAVVANAITVSAVTCALIWLRSAWRPRLLFSRRSLLRLAGFASLLSLTRLVAAIQRSADRILIGRVLGATALGAYAVPASIVAVPAARLVDPIRSVLFPAFSKLQQSPAELATMWLRVTRLVFALLAPVLVLVAAAADEIVELALTSRWSEAAPVLRILALAAVCQLAGAMNAVVLTALGRLPTVLRVLSATAVLSIAGFAIGQRYGLAGAAAGYAAATVVAAPLYLALTARSLRLTARRVATAYSAPALGLLAMAPAVTIVEAAGNGWPAAARLAALILLGFSLYTAVALGGSRELRGDVRAVAGRPRE